MQFVWDSTPNLYETHTSRPRHSKALVVATAAPPTFAEHLLHGDLQLVSPGKNINQRRILMGDKGNGLDAVYEKDAAKVGHLTNELLQLIL